MYRPILRVFGRRNVIQNKCYSHRHVKELEATSLKYKQPVLLRYFLNAFFVLKSVSKKSFFLGVYLFLESLINIVLLSELLLFCSDYCVYVSADLTCHRFNGDSKWHKLSCSLRFKGMKITVWRFEMVKKY